MNSGSSSQALCDVPGSGVQRPGRARVAGEAIFVSALIISVAIFLIHLKVGDAALILPYVRGDSLVVAPLDFNLDGQPAGGEFVSQVTVHNLTAGPVQLLGAERHCNCLVAALEFPLAITAGGSHTFEVRLSLPATAGAFSQDMILFTDVDDRQRIPLSFSGMLIE